MKVKNIEKLIEQVYFVPYSTVAEGTFSDMLKSLEDFVEENHFLRAKSYKDSLKTIQIKVHGLSKFKSNEDRILHKNIQRDIAALARQILDENKKVFIVHGRNTAMRHQVTSALGRLKIDWSVLESESNGGNTVIEKFLTNAEDCRYAIILFSADDLGKLNNSEEPLKLRTRQNVILELGFFLAKVGRKNLFILHEVGKDIESPSDFNGIVSEVLDDFGGWKAKLIKEMKKSGMYINESLAERL